MTMNKRIEELKIRIEVCKFSIELLEKNPNDPRQPEALNHYRSQLAVLEREYIEASKPTYIVIHLKPATLSADTPK